MSGFGRYIERGAYMGYSTLELQTDTGTFSTAPGFFRLAGLNSEDGM
jgi:hypothetical protein